MSYNRAIRILKSAGWGRKQLESLSLGRAVYLASLVILENNKRLVV